MGSSERDVTILFLLASNILSSTRQNFLNWQQRSFYFFLCFVWLAFYLSAADLVATIMVTR